MRRPQILVPALIEYVKQNPGETASQIGNMMIAEGKSDSVGSVAATLYKICKRGVLERQMARGSKSKHAWRYYPLGSIKQILAIPASAPKNHKRGTNGRIIDPPSKPVVRF